MKRKFKQIVRNNKIVYANWFLRQLDALWYFIYFHILPLRTWRRLIEIKYEIIYAFERAFTGYDRRISWGYYSTIRFYKRMLSDLYKYTQAFPGNLENIAPEEWQKVIDKWLPVFKTREAFDKAATFIEESGLSEDQYKEFSDDCFHAWKDYIKRVLHYFEEADEETCSQKNELEDQFVWNMEKNRQVVEYNGELCYSYPSTHDSNDPQDLINSKIFERDEEIEKYRMEQLNLGMQEIAKNLTYFGD